MYFNIQLYLITPLFHISIWKNLRHFCRAFTLRQCQLPSTSSLWNGRGMQKREKGSLVILTSQNATISKLQCSWISSGLLNIIRKIALLGCTQTEEVLSGVKTQNNPFPHHSICACDIQTHEKHMQRRKRGGNAVTLQCNQYSQHCHYQKCQGSWLCSFRCLTWLPQLPTYRCLKINLPSSSPQ